MKKITNIHGDVTLVKVNSIPKDAKKIQWEKGFILERGEGVHTHIIEDKCEIYEKGINLEVPLPDIFKPNSCLFNWSVFNPNIEDTCPALDSKELIFLLNLDL